MRIGTQLIINGSQATVIGQNMQSGKWIIKLFPTGKIIKRHI